MSYISHLKRYFSGVQLDVQFNGDRAQQENAKISLAKLQEIDYEHIHQWENCQKVLRAVGFKLDEEQNPWKFFSVQTDGPVAPTKSTLYQRCTVLQRTLDEVTDNLDKVQELRNKAKWLYGEAEASLQSVVHNRRLALVGQSRLPQFQEARLDAESEK